LYTVSASTVCQSPTWHRALPGHVLNQFSMDEIQRIPAHRDNQLLQPEWRSRALAYAPVSRKDKRVVLDKSLTPLKTRGTLARDEQIYSPGSGRPKAYLVTYKRTDPLFVIGLQDPAKPTGARQLNVTGVSDYYTMTTRHISSELDSQAPTLRGRTRSGHRSQDQPLQFQDPKQPTENKPILMVVPEPARLQSTTTNSPL